MQLPKAQASLYPNGAIIPTAEKKCHHQRENISRIYFHPAITQALHSIAAHSQNIANVVSCPKKKNLKFSPIESCDLIRTNSIHSTPCALNIFYFHGCLNYALLTLVHHDLLDLGVKPDHTHSSTSCPHLFSWSATHTHDGSTVCQLLFPSILTVFILRQPSGLICQARVVVWGVADSNARVSGVISPLVKVLGLQLLWGLSDPCFLTNIHSSVSKHLPNKWNVNSCVSWRLKFIKCHSHKH